jgi:Putative Actinobacterial Holin-X, holin superfamily III
MPQAATPPRTRAQSGPLPHIRAHRRRVGDISVGDLIGNVTRDLSTLMRQELALAQAEVKQEVSKTAKGAAAMSGAAVAGYFVLLFLSIALWAGLSNVMNAGWAGLIVAVLWAVIGGALFAVGRSKLREVHPKPERTVDTLSNVPDALKGQRGGTR